VVAYDVIGGFFAVNGGGIGPDRGVVYYYAPDSLEWEGLGLQYSAWLEWACTEAVDEFYEEARWPAWEAEAAAVGPGDGISIVPFPVLGDMPNGERSRRVVPLEELWALYVTDLPAQLRREAPHAR